MLPTDRSYPALGPSDPVPSALLLELQDMIKGAKHPEFEDGYHAACFTSVVAGASGVFDETRWIWDGANAFDIHAGLVYPVGTRITRIQYAYKRGTGGNVNLQLWRQPVGGGAQVLVDSFSDAGADASYQEHEIVFNHVMLSGFLYKLEMSATLPAASTGAELLGATVFRDRL